MPVKTIDELKAFFETGDVPTEDNYIDVFDTIEHLFNTAPSGTALQNIVEDLTPELGGDIDFLNFRALNVGGFETTPVTDNFKLRAFVDTNSDNNVIEFQVLDGSDIIIDRFQISKFGSISYTGNFVSDLIISPTGNFNNISVNNSITRGSVGIVNIGENAGEFNTMFLNSLNISDITFKGGIENNVVGLLTCDDDPDSSIADITLDVVDSLKIIVRDYINPSILNSLSFDEISGLSIETVTDENNISLNGISLNCFHPTNGDENRKVTLHGIFDSVGDKVDIGLTLAEDVDFYIKTSSSSPSSNDYLFPSFLSVSPEDETVIRKGDVLGMNIFPTSPSPFSNNLSGFSSFSQILDFVDNLVVSGASPLSDSGTTGLRFGILGGSPETPLTIGSQSWYWTRIGDIVTFTITLANLSGTLAAGSATLFVDISTTTIPAVDVTASISGVTAPLFNTVANVGDKDNFNGAVLTVPDSTDPGLWKMIHKPAENQDYVVVTAGVSGGTTMSGTESIIISGTYKTV